MYAEEKAWEVDSDGRVGVLWVGRRASISLNCKHRRTRDDRYPLYVSRYSSNERCLTSQHFVHRYTAETVDILTSGESDLGVKHILELLGGTSWCGPVSLFFSLSYLSSSNQDLDKL